MQHYLKRILPINKNMDKLDEAISEVKQLLMDQTKAIIQWKDTVKERDATIQQLQAALMQAQASKTTKKKFYSFW
jgi:septal ring factor EnvC (AmiA/AmiB activator)